MKDTGHKTLMNLNPLIPNQFYYLKKSQITVSQ
jgi:hypothetical protein